MGPDEMYLKVLRELAHKIVKPLCVISEKFLRSSEVPGDWKWGNITPLLKKEKKLDLENYRPVSFISVLGKIREQILFDLLHSGMDVEIPLVDAGMDSMKLGQILK